MMTEETPPNVATVPERVAVLTATVDQLQAELEQAELKLQIVVFTIAALAVAVILCRRQLAELAEAVIS